MQIEEVTKTVFLGPEGREFLSRAEAEGAFQRAAHEACVEWLSDALCRVGGAGYDFDARGAAEWVVANLDFIYERTKRLNGALE